MDIIISLNEIKTIIYNALKIRYCEHNNNQIDRTKWNIYDFEIIVEDRCIYYGDEDEYDEDVTAIEVYALLEKFTPKTNRRATKRIKMYLV